jgi:enoyl-CoA hydratase/carnithine racemase
MSDPVLLRHDQGAVTTLTLNTPASLNALSTPMLTALSAALTDIAGSTQRAVILNAAGRNFCAGHDLKEIQAHRSDPDHGAAAYVALFDLCTKVMLQLTALPQPVIAVVQGIATAAGCQLAASCDMVVATDSARFGVNGVNIGLFCSTPLVALSRKIPAAIAFDLAATGEFLTVYRATELGLVNHITSPGNLQNKALDLALTLAGKLPSALALGKRAFAGHNAAGLAAAYATASAAMVENLLNPDTDEGITAFLAKRAPAWGQV